MKKKINTKTLKIISGGDKDKSVNELNSNDTMTNLSDADAKNLILQTAKHKCGNKITRILNSSANCSDFGRGKVPDNEIIPWKPIINCNHLVWSEPNATFYHCRNPSNKKKGRCSSKSSWFGFKKKCKKTGKKY